MKRRFTNILYAGTVAAALAIAAIGFVSCGEKSSLTKIAIVPSDFGMAIGTTRQLTGYGVLSSGLIFFESYLAWTSSNPDIAAVSSTGLVTAGSTTGTATITATETDSHTNVSGTTVVTVCTISSIAVTPVDPGMAINTLSQFTATATLSSDVTFTQNVTSYMTWTSSKTDVATVSSTGIVTAGSITGVATITATEGDLIRASGADPIVIDIVLTVTSSALSSIVVTAENTGISTGLSHPLIATGTYADATMSVLTLSMTWSSSDTAVATVDSTGLVTGVSPGTATITAKDPITAVSGNIAITVN